MRVLMTGGTGFIGSSLVKALLEDQCVITVVSRQQPDRVKQQLSSAVRVVGSIAELNPSNGFDAIINLAGAGIMDKRWSDKRKQVLIDSRVGVTLALVDFMEKMPQKPSLFISGSATGYYGAQDASVKLDEQCGVGHDFGASLCLQWEQAALKVEHLGIRVCLVRTGIVLHPSGGALKKMLPAFKAGLGGPIASGQQVMSWIHREDMIRLLMFLLHKPGAEGVYNATAPNPVANSVFSRALGKALGRPAFLPVPAAALRFALGESSQLLIEGQAVYPVRLSESGFSFLYPDIDLALQDLFV